MAVTIKQKRPISNDDLLDLSRRNPGYQFELSKDGDLVVTPTGGKSGRRSAEVLSQLGTWNRSVNQGVLFDSSTGFMLPDGSVLSPDVSWVQHARWNRLTEEEQESFAPLCPDVVFEVRSKSDKLAELRSKMRAYLENGARLAVLIAPYERFVEVYRPGQEPEHLPSSQPVSFDPELPGFALDTTALFA
jgi:Uma2 family endonuclease